MRKRDFIFLDQAAWGKQIEFAFVYIENEVGHKNQINRKYCEAN